MTISTIWVYAEAAGGEPTSGTLELLTKARSLAPNVAAVLGSDGAAAAAALGAHGASKVYATGDLGSKLPGPAVASAIKAAIDGGEAPDAILFASTYESRDVAAACPSSSTARSSRTTSTSPSTATACRSRRRSSAATRW